MKMRLHSVNMHDDTWKRLEKLAAEERVPMSVVLRRALVEYLERVEEKKR